MNCVGLLGMVVVAGCGRDGAVFKSAIALTVDLSAHHMFIVGFLGWADVYTQELICTSNPMTALAVKHGPPLATDNAPSWRGR